MRVITLRWVCSAKGAANFSRLGITSGWAPPIGMRRLTSDRHMWFNSLCTAALATDERYSGEPARHAEPSATMAATATHPAVPDECDR